MTEQKERLVKDYIVHLRIGTVAVITAGLVTTLIGVGVAYQKVQGSITHLNAKTDLYAERYDAFQTRVNTNEKNYIEIKTRLDAIMSSIIDLKK